nr:DUF4395 domain-containing protein [Mucilaginibacter sp. E4BP6]
MDCPVDFIKINENKARLTAFFVLVLTLVYLKTGFWLIMAFLLVDFVLRATSLGKYSLLGFISDAVIKQLKIKPKLVDRAPKRFAAMVGVLFTAVILVSFILQLHVVALSLAAVLAFFAFLESFFAFCAGCYAYSAGKYIISKF